MAAFQHSQHGQITISVGDGDDTPDGTRGTPTDFAVCDQLRDVG